MQRFCEPLSEALADPLLRLVESFGDPADCHVLAPLCLQEICYRILRSNAFSVLKSAIAEEDTRLVRAMRFIEAHAHRNDLSIDQIASQIAMSPSRFAHRFSALLGMSPMQYRKQIRLEKARQYLLSAQISVALAAEAAGYASTSHFNRDFNSAFGLPPRRYAETVRKLGTVRS
ncbi:helix-turn-helix domain-containing protein [Roseibium salinum]|uniref:helix-turn-helix domain-containing protein n=1 Tax=Roseibium salinum TaxID=1604349 RepID=UPI00361E3228